MKQHEITLRVRYAETDQMGVVYYSNHLIWFEIARTEFFRSLGLDYSKLEKEKKIYLPVAEAYCRYRAPLRYDDAVSVVVRLKEAGNTRLFFEYDIMKDGKVAATGYTSHAFINGSGRPIPVPEEIRAILSA